MALESLVLQRRLSVAQGQVMAELLQMDAELESKALLTECDPSQAHSSVVDPNLLHSTIGGELCEKSFPDTQGCSAHGVVRLFLLVASTRMQYLKAMIYLLVMGFAMYPLVLGLHLLLYLLVKLAYKVS